MIRRHGGNRNHRQGILHGRREADGQNGADTVFCVFKIGNRNRQKRPASVLQQIGNEEQGCGKIGNRRSKSGTCSSHSEEAGQDKNGVEQDVQYASGGNTRGCDSRASFRSDEIGKQYVQNCSGSAEDNRPHDISAYQLIGFCRCAAYRKYRLHENKNDEGKQNRGCQSEPE